MTVIRQSTARTILVGPILDADGVAVTTGPVIGDIRLTKNGVVSAAAAAATLVHNHGGKWLLAMIAGNTDTVGVLEISLNDGVNDMPVKSMNVVEEAVFDAMYAASAAGPLQSTVAGRKLDVTAGGTAGIDWANVENPENETDLVNTLIQTVDGNVTGSVGSVATDVTADLVKIHGASLTETVHGYLAAAFIKLFDVASPVLVASDVMVGTDNASTFDADTDQVDIGLWNGSGVTTSSTTNKPEVDIASVHDDATAASNLELQYDTTGLSGSTFPATQSQVNNIGSGATGGTHVEATYDNTTRDVIVNGGAADLKGGGLVGIPVTGHTFVVGREVTIANTVSYNGAFEVVSQTTNEVVITHSQDAETFGPDDTIVSSIKGEIFVGTITSGTFADTAAQQGTLHSMDDDGNDINIVYGFNVGGSRQATDIAIFANVNGNTDEIIVKAYNFVLGAFEAKATLEGSGGTAFVPLDPELIARNTGTGTEIGDVFILFDTVTTTPSSLDVDKCLLTAVGTNVLIGYPNGFEIAAGGTSGTEFGVNGTAGNPCPFADALTMNATTPLNLFTIQNGETVALSGNKDGITLNGHAWTLTLGSASIANMHVSGAGVSGLSTGSGSEFDDCDMGTCTIAPCSIIKSRFTSKTGGGFTMQTAGDYTFHGCASMVPSNDAPVFTFPGAGDTFVSDRAGSGGRQYEGMSAGDLATVEGWGQFIEGTCSGGAVTIRGCLTKSGITNITLTDNARIDIGQINAQVDTAIVTYGLDHLLAASVSGADVTDNSILARLVSASATADWDDFVNTTDSLQAITDSLAALPTAAENADAVADEVITAAEHNIPNSLARKLRQLASVVIANDTAEVSNSPTANQIQLASGESAVDGTFDPGLVGIVGGTGAGQSRRVLEYEGSTRLCTLNRDWKIPPDGTSEYIMMSDPGGLHVNEGLAQGGSSTSITLNSLASSVDNLYNGQFVFLVSGPGQDQVGRVMTYNGTTKVATIMTTLNGWASGQAPTNATGYVMVPILDTVPTLIGTPANTVSDDIAAVKTDTGNLITRITAALFTGITSMAQWLGALAGKQASDATAQTEMRATGAGSGSYLSTTDSNEAGRDRGDAAWPTATGFSTHDAAAVKTAMEADGGKLDHLWETTEDDAGTRRFTIIALAHAPGGGNVTVGSLTQAALALFATQDTGEGTAVSGSVAKLAQGAAGGNVTLASDGLDLVIAEVGTGGKDTINARQALSIILAGMAGDTTGTEDDDIIVKGGNSSVTRIRALLDGNNNMTITLTPPS